MVTGMREIRRERERIKKESSYLSILVIAHLDRFVDGCVQVSFDDGTSEGQPAGQNREFHEVTVRPPTFDPLSLDVDWKVLPVDLMYDILNLPYRTEQLANYVAHTGEFDDPPDYIEFFRARRHGYAVLGLEVSSIATSLRKYAGLPISVQVEGDWNRDEMLREQRDRIDRERIQH
jgi:hypothetical protein